MLIKNKLHEIPGCNVKSLSHKTGCCEVEYNHEDLSDLAVVINNAGYSLTDENQKKPEISHHWTTKLASLVFA
jgi:hypothetical protein